MEKKDIRPQNGPGANTLRGGLKSFNTKTVLYNWLEDAGGPQGYRPGFTTEEYLSEAQRQQLGARNIPLFGSGLPDTSVIMYPPEAKDIFQPSCGPGSNTWESTTQATLKPAVNSGTTTGQIPPAKSTGCNMTRKELEEYRANWSHDTVESKQLRFETEARRMTQHAGKFKEYVVRMPPGSSDTLLKMREQLLEKHGALALSRLKYSLGTGIVQTETLFSTLVNLKLDFTRLEFFKVAYIYFNTVIYIS